jgi:hypothetical protein
MAKTNKKTIAAIIINKNKESVFSKYDNLNIKDLQYTLKFDNKLTNDEIIYIKKLIKIKK